MCTGFLVIQTEKLNPCHNCAYPSTGQWITHMFWDASFKGGFINLAYSLPLSHYFSGEVGWGFTVGGGTLLLWWGLASVLCWSNDGALSVSTT